MTGNLPLRLPAASIGPAGSARPASVDVTWREHLKKIPAPARPFFSNPPGQRVEDYPTYIEFINRALARSDFCPAHLIRVREFVDAWFASATCDRVKAAIIQNAMRGAARCLIADWLRDGERADEESRSWLIDIATWRSRMPSAWRKCRRLFLASPGI